jgi:DNA-binding CsgD family transcriptional regulator
VDRRWTPFRLGAVITACVVYFGVGTVYHLTGFRLRYAVIAALIFFVALAVILADAARNIKRIRKTTTRITVSILSLLSFIFLPLVMAGKVITEFEVSVETPVAVTPDLRFLFLTLYFFWMALTGIVFYMRELSIVGPAGTGAMEISTDLPLTGREREVAKALAKGLTYGEIADDLDISPHTVRNHVANVYKKLAVRSKVELIGVLRGERE